jgi:hypothetical protein
MKAPIFFSAFLVLLVTGAIAKAQTMPSSPKLSANAALQYWPGFEFMPKTDADEKIINNWQDTPLDETTALILEHGQRSLNYLHLGVGIPDCDWGLDLSQGPNLLLPYLSKSRALAQLACFRLRFDFQNKHSMAAVDDACDVLAFARHIAQNPILISILVQGGIERMTIETLAAHLNELDGESIKYLAHRLDQLPRSSTLDETVKVESELDIQWTIQKMEEAGDAPDWSHLFSFLQLQNPAKDVPALVKEAGGTPDAVTKKLQDLVVYHEEVAKLLSLSLPQQEFREKYTELQSRYNDNPFAKLLLPDYAKVYDIETGAKTRRLMLRAAIAVLQNGPESIKSWEDPNHQSLTYAKKGDGFQLSSKVTSQGQGVTLLIGSGE